MPIEKLERAHWLYQDMDEVMDLINELVDAVNILMKPRETCDCYKDRYCPACGKRME